MGTFGIDLGTSHCCCGVWSGDGVRIIPTEQGDSTTPSFVAFTDAGRLVGEAARGQAARNPSNTLSNFKLLLGRHFSDPEVRAALLRWPFRVVCGPADQPLIEVSHQGEAKLFTGVEVCGMLLAKLKADAEEYLGRQVESAVVSVPACFGMRQVQAVKDALDFTGLRTMRVIHSSTAAAVAYCLKTRALHEDDWTVLVFDLGGGICEASVVSFSEGIIEVKSVCSDASVGGALLDDRLKDHFRQEFESKHRGNLLQSPRALCRLSTACEHAKRVLSSSQQASIELDSLLEGIDFYSTITRAQFEELCAADFDKCISLVERALQDAQVQPNQIQEVVLVGGCSRIPGVQARLRGLLGREVQLYRALHAEEAVVHGTAAMAALLSGEQSEALSDLLYLPVIAHSIGIELAGGYMSVLVPRNTTIPTKKEQYFSTHFDSQPGATIKVYEGERSRTKDNILLGVLELSGIPPEPHGVPQISVSFDIDANSLVTVTVTNKDTHQSCSMMLDRLTLSTGAAPAILHPDWRLVPYEEREGSSKTPSGPSAPTPAPPPPAPVPAAQRSPLDLGEALREAAAKGEVASIRSLLAAGASLASASTQGNSALHLAAGKGHLGAVGALLQAGASPDARNASQESPLHRAAAGGHGIVVEELLRAGADARAVDQDGDTALHSVARCWEPCTASGHLTAARALLAAGGSPHVANKEGQTPAGQAAEAGAAELQALFGQAAAPAGPAQPAISVAVHWNVPAGWPGASSAGARTS